MSQNRIVTDTHSDDIPANSAVPKGSGKQKGLCFKVQKVFHEITDVSSAVCCFNNALKE